MSSLIKKKVGGCCVAVGCNMRKGTNLLSQVKLFNFPRDPERRKLWEVAVHRVNWKASNSSQLCNLHFVSGSPSKDPLHSDYVPSIFSFKKDNPPTVARYERHAKRLKTDASYSRGKLCSIKDKNNPDLVPSLNMDHQKINNIDATVARCERNFKFPDKTGRKCVICRAKPVDCPNRIFHSFPKNPLLSDEWAAIVGRNDIINASPIERTSRFKVCSHHFADDDYISGSKRRFKGYAIPRFNVPCSRIKIDVGSMKRKLNSLIGQEISKENVDIPRLPATIDNPLPPFHGNETIVEETTDCGDMNNSDWIPTINLDSENKVDLVAIVFRNDRTCMSAVDKVTDEDVACLNKENKVHKQKEQLLINEEININFPESDSSQEVLRTTTDCSSLSSENFSEENSSRTYEINKETTCINFSKTVSSQETLRTITDCSFISTENFSEENSFRTYYEINKENTDINFSKTVSSQEKLRTITDCSFVRSENSPRTYSKTNKEIDNINLRSHQIFSVKENFTFKYLLKNLSHIKRPNIFWSVVSPHSNVIICARWSEDYTCRKRVVIGNSLVVRVFLNEWEINLSDFVNIKCIDDICNLLQKVESSVKYHGLK